MPGSPNATRPLCKDTNFFCNRPSSFTCRLWPSEWPLSNGHAYRRVKITKYDLKIVHPLSHSLRSSFFTATSEIREGKYGHRRSVVPQTVVRLSQDFPSHRQPLLRCGRWRKNVHVYISYSQTTHAEANWATKALHRCVLNPVCWGKVAQSACLNPAVLLCPCSWSAVRDELAWGARLVRGSNSCPRFSVANDRQFIGNRYSAITCLSAISTLFPRHNDQ